MLLVDEGALEREVDEAVDDVAGKRRYLPQQQLAARGGLQHPQHIVDGGIRLVDLVEKQETGDLLVLELAQDELELRHLLLVELAHHDRGVDCGERRAHVVDEFDRAWRIDKSIVVALEAGGGDGDFDAHLVVTRFLAGVTHGVARVDRALALDRAGTGEDRFEQRGLAALERAHQRNAPWTRRSCAVLCHVRLPNRPRCGPLRGRSRYRFKPEGDLARGAASQARPRNAADMRASHAAQETAAPTAAAHISRGSCSRQGPGRRRSSATPTAKLSPTELSIETGCSATVRLEPPTSTLAPRPAAMVTSPLAPK